MRNSRSMLWTSRAQHWQIVRDVGRSLSMHVPCCALVIYLIYFVIYRKLLNFVASETKLFMPGRRMHPENGPEVPCRTIFFWSCSNEKNSCDFESILLFIRLALHGRSIVGGKFDGLEFWLTITVFFNSFLPPSAFFESASFVVCVL